MAFREGFLTGAKTQSMRGVQVDKDLREMLIKPDAQAPKRIGLRVWHKAIPQFNLGHLEVVQVLMLWHLDFI